MTLPRLSTGFPIASRLSEAEAWNFSEAFCCCKYGEHATDCTSALQLAVPSRLNILRNIHLFLNYHVYLLMNDK